MTRRRRAATVLPHHPSAKPPRPLDARDLERAQLTVRGPHDGAAGIEIGIACPATVISLLPRGPKR